MVTITSQPSQISSSKTSDINTILEPSRLANESSRDVSGMAACINDVVKAFELDASLESRPMITDYSTLLRVLQYCKESLPLEYQVAFADPYITSLENLGAYQFNQIMRGRDARAENLRSLIFDMNESIIQYYESYKEQASDAFREVTSDLYKGFLTASQRRSGETGIHIKPPEHGILPPMIKWGNPSQGPYTYTAPATNIFNAGPALVSLPPSNSEKGLVAWSALGHETGGHDILHADEGLIRELKNLVYNEVNQQLQIPVVAEYWANCLDETASDVLGLLNMGPAAGVGLIAYFRGIQKALHGQAILRNEGSLNGPHPIDILRAFVAASTIELFDQFDPDLKDHWASLIRKAAQEDLDQRGGYFVINGYRVRADVFIDSAAIAAKTIANQKLAALENHSFSEILTWTDDDERITNILRGIIKDRFVPRRIQEGLFASHTVAAATLEALSDPNPQVGAIFNTMKGILATMHSTNQTWVDAPQRFSPHFVYQIPSEKSVLTESKESFDQALEKLSPTKA